MYVDPNTGGMLFQILAASFVVISGFLLVFSGKIRMFFARLRRGFSNDHQVDTASSKEDNGADSEANKS